MRNRKNLRKTAYYCVILILVLVLIFSGLQILESTILLKKQQVEPVRASKTVTKDGIAYSGIGTGYRWTGGFQRLLPEFFRSGRGDVVNSG